jgi:photosystem II stability/assembly factor-like uncharacterized protein
MTTSIALGRRQALLGAAAMAALRPRASRASVAATAPILTSTHQPCGVGGGGGFVGFSMSPYQKLWFVGTDMGTLFRSTNEGGSWQAVPNQNATFLLSLNGQDYTDLPGPGYSATPDVVFHAPATGTPIRSLDGGITWAPMTLGSDSLRVRFWMPDSNLPGHVFAGLDDGLAVTFDDGVTWSYIGAGLGRARGAFLDAATSTLYVGFANMIMTSTNGGATFNPLLPVTSLHRFAGGRGANGITLAYVQEPSLGGAVFVGGPTRMVPARVNTNGVITQLTGAEHVQMAENDDLVYVAGARGWPQQLGTSVWRGRGGLPFSLMFLQADQGYGVVPWPTLTPSAVGLDIGYWDDGYFTFAVNQCNSAQLGGGELYFLHVSFDCAKTWCSPFTSPVNTAAPGPGQAWRSTGLEVCSIRWVKFSTVAPLFGLACGCDYSILVTEDGGRTWRIATSEGTWGRIRAPHQSCYDVLFDPVDPNTMIVAMSDLHDFQHWGNFGRVAVGSGIGGGVYISRDRGRSFTQLGPGTPQSCMPFVSLAQNPVTGTIYAGSQGNGVAIMDANGNNWQWFSTGILDPNAIISQLMVDAPTGDVYALVGSDPSDPLPNWQWSGLYRLPYNGVAWQQLRGTPAPPYWHADTTRLMVYPTSFALQRNEQGQISTLFVTDAERCGNYLETGLWASTDGGQTWTRRQQYTFCTNVSIDPWNSNLVFLSGDTSPGWGVGGALYSTDGGQTFQVNTAFPIQYSTWSVTPDPNDPTQMFTGCFGGGVRHGPKPGAAAAVSAVAAKSPTGG